MIYRDDIVRAAVRTASIKPHQPPLEIIPVVVIHFLEFIALYLISYNSFLCLELGFLVVSTWM